jgi:hypothetical protein
MPVRQRSPTSQGSSAVSPPSDDPAYRTMRSRNPDGSSTVYHVHEGVMMSRPPPPPPAHYYVGEGGGGGPASHHGIGLDRASYANYMPSSYMPYDHGHPNFGMQYPQQQQRRPNVAFYKDDDDDEGDDDGATDEYDDTEDDGSYATDVVESRSLVPYSSSSSSSIPPSTKDATNRDGRRSPWCSRNSTPCILVGMIFGIGFIVGYVFLIEAIVARSRASRRVVPANATAGPIESPTSPNVGLRGGDSPTPLASARYVPPVGSALAAQLDLEPRYFVLDQVLRPVDAREVPPPKTPSDESSSSRSIVVPGHGQDGSSGGPEGTDPTGESTSSWTHSIGIDRGGSNEPVRRER